jgi:Beta-ketoacyl synthase, N-terminal domain
MMSAAEKLQRPISAAAQPAALRLHVAGWAAVSAERSDPQEWMCWLRGEQAPPDSAPPGVPLPSSFRRRITPIGQMAFRAALSIGQRAQARFIFCSRHGEFRRTKTLLEALARREEPSPAEFSLAVHNALAGILSIEWKNSAGHSALAAGADSFGFGLLEAAACLAARPAEPVLLVYFDEGLHEEYAELREADETGLALALLLTSGPSGGADVLLSFASRPRRSPPRPATEQALDFLRFLLSDETERIFSGGSIEWRWHRDAA